MHITQPIVAAAIVASGVLADQSTFQSGQSGQYKSPAVQKLALNAGQSSSYSPPSLSSSSSSTSKLDSNLASTGNTPSTGKTSTGKTSSTEKTSSKKVTTAAKDATPQSPTTPEAPKKQKNIIEKAKGISKMLFGKTERQKQRTNAKKNGDYIRKQKSASEITTDATGTKQPASLSDPNVNIMEAFSDLVKRYSGQEKPDKSQFREDIITVFESRAEKGDLTSKQYRQGYKMRKLKPNGVGKKRSTKKTKRDVEEGLEVREAEPEEEISIEAREAEAFADPDAVVYEDDAELFTREPEEDSETLIARKEDDDDDDEKETSAKKDDDDEDKPKPKPKKTDDSKDDDDETGDDSDSDAAEKKKAKKKAAIKKKVAAMRKLAAKKALAIKKKLLAAKKKAAEREGDNDDDEDQYDDDDSEYSRPSKSKSKSKSKSTQRLASSDEAKHRKNLKKIAKLRAAIVAAQQNIDKQEHQDDQLHQQYQEHHENIYVPPTPHPAFAAAPVRVAAAPSYPQAFTQTFPQAYSVPFQVNNRPRRRNVFADDIEDDLLRRREEYLYETYGY